jgi:hypothetical protein
LGVTGVTLIGAAVTLVLGLDTAGAYDYNLIFFKIVAPPLLDGTPLKGYAEQLRITSF